MKTDETPEYFQAMPLMQLINKCIDLAVETERPNNTLKSDRQYRIAFPILRERVANTEARMKDYENRLSNQNLF